MTGNGTRDLVVVGLYGLDNQVAASRIYFLMLEVVSPPGL